MAAENPAVRGRQFPEPEAEQSAVYYGNRSSIIYLGGDVITKIDGIKIASLADYYSALESKRPGDQIEVVVHRNRKDVKLKITLSE